jgi:nicotinate-nucleotide pyrophosphorylase (carboxylating)
MGGSIEEAVKKVKQNLSHAHKIEVECDTIEQVKKCLNSGVDIIMLDNMTPSMVKECVALINKQAIIEISGSVNLSNLEELAKTGADIISTSAIVAKAPTLDLAFDYAG